ncbi:MAG: hypothetical protein HXX20_02180 [Chloroflexi bacterium]|nr:hypothetical protein [Chloroflexota bacterium]
MAEELGVSYDAVRNQLKKGVSPDLEEKVAGKRAATLNHNVISRPEQQTEEQVVFGSSLAPVHSVFEISKGLEWLQQEMGKIYEQAVLPKDKVFILDQFRQIYSEAADVLESLHNMELLDAFINEVTTILAEQEPRARERIYQRLESCAMGAGAAILVSDTCT